MKQAAPGINKRKKEIVATADSSSPKSGAADAVDNGTASDKGEDRDQNGDLDRDRPHSIPVGEQLAADGSVIQAIKRRGVSSLVWKYATKVPGATAGERRVMCNSCQKQLCFRSNSTSAINRHVASCNPEFRDLKLNAGTANVTRNGTGDLSATRIASARPRGTAGAAGGGGGGRKGKKGSGVDGAADQAPPSASDPQATAAAGGGGDAVGGGEGSSIEAVNQVTRTNPSASPQATATGAVAAKGGRRRGKKDTSAVGTADRGTPTTPSAISIPQGTTGATAAAATTGEDAAAGAAADGEVRAHGATAAEAGDGKVRRNLDVFGDAGLLGNEGTTGSLVWLYATKVIVDGKRCAVCNNCKKQLSLRGGTTTSIRRHVSGCVPELRQTGLDSFV